MYTITVPIWAIIIGVVALYFLIGIIIARIVHSYEGKGYDSHLFTFFWGPLVIAVILAMPLALVAIPLEKAAKFITEWHND